MLNGPSAAHRVLFLGTENSARSQMAEGLLRASRQVAVQVFSAGSQPVQLHPLAVETLAQMGVDISWQQAKHLDEFAGQLATRIRFLLITVQSETDQRNAILDLRFAICDLRFAICDVDRKSAFPEDGSSWPRYSFSVRATRAAARWPKG